MGARPSSFKKGGGFLNGVDGTILDYEFSDEVPSKDGGREPFKPGKDPKTKKERFHSLFVYLTVRPDGADEHVTTSVFAGGADDFVVSEDGKTLTAADGGPCSIGANTGAGKLINSLCDAGFPETNFSEDDESVNWEPMIGTRCRFVQRKDEETTRKLGKRKDKKTGREYDRTDLIIDQVYEAGNGTVEAAEEKPKAGAKGKPATKAAAPVKGKAAVKKNDDVDLDDLAKETLVDILGDNDGKIQKTKLSMKVLQKLMKHPQREDVRKRIFDDEFLGLEDGWSYNPSKGLIEIAA